VQDYSPALGERSVQRRGKAAVNSRSPKGERFGVRDYSPALGERSVQRRGKAAVNSRSPKGERFEVRDYRPALTGVVRCRSPKQPVQLRLLYQSKPGILYASFDFGDIVWNYSNNR
jgi:hypothetical protein